MPTHTTVSLSATRAAQLKILAKAAKVASATLVENLISKEWKRHHPATELPGFAFLPTNEPAAGSLQFGLDDWPLLHLHRPDAIQLGHSLLNLVDNRRAIEFATRSGDWVSCSPQGRGFSLTLRIAPKGQEKASATATRGLSPELLRDLGEALIEAAKK